MLTAAYLDMLPWVVFAVMVRRGGLGPVDAAGGATAAAALLTAMARRRGRPAPVARVGLGTFALLLAAAIAAPPLTPPPGSLRSATVMLLAVVLAASLRWAPLAAAYLADDVPPRAQRTAGFHAAVRQVTAAWAAGAALVGASFAVLALGDTPFESTFWGWLVPLVATTATLAWSLARWQTLRALAMEPPEDLDGLSLGVLSDRPHSAPGGGLRPTRAVERLTAGSERGLPGLIGLPAEMESELEAEGGARLEGGGSEGRWWTFAGARRGRRRLVPGLTGHLGGIRRGH